MDLIVKEFDGQIGTIILNNDSKKNCLSNLLLQQFIKALEELKEQNARVVVVRAHKGVKVWSAGFNIEELPDPGRDPLSYNEPIEEMIRSVQKFPAPIIAMVDGSVWGGACDLVSVCDMVIGSENASFAITPAKIGIPYNPTGILHFINMVGLHTAKEMFFTALPLNADQAYNHGILNHLVQSEEIEEYTYKCARQILDNSPLSISVIKEQLRILSNSSPINTETFEKIQGLRRTAYDSYDYMEGKRAFKEKRKPVFIGK